MLIANNIVTNIENILFNISAILLLRLVIAHD